MIKHHPKFELIQSFVNGDLPASLSAGIAIHADLCPVCQQKIAQLTEQVAEVSFEEAFLDRFIVEEKQCNERVAEFDIEKMIDGITASSDIDIVEPKIEKIVSFKESTYSLPSVLSKMDVGKAANIGKLSRSRIHLNECEIHTSLLHIDPGGGVPEHTHRGFELTVLLEGSFSDEYGEYVKGDFIMLDGSHQHNPVSENGCLCYTVANDALQFTQGINRLLNPIGSFIY
ncbi:ChrR family anti-sigma-E factor [Thalassotalea atypica]|uniref:ChrR family anti-sigma-E factor n=1 Tax=Thalassotalea atypica TaxID=2054316 RepID=UPI0025743203|nr:ChrR family anti-sigma-E factor [Thalassotalea atypica]